MRPPLRRCERIETIHVGALHGLQRRYAPRNGGFFMCLGS
ncbi:hypothetical protein BLL52_1775 [Rhodoferax antarcticus ANT.BR]|uniref:Uncharacterized protein n=1 Tax=Rhodoferax antarcticus ANT.BR TaxID=1111071 RepID=A0A1Q8YG48_9BURK|nr:hypothetical protein BLL52_1775 [Rhodoferax antarcticus ANT.BR]